MSGEDDRINTTGTGPQLEPLGPDDPHEVAGYRLVARIGEGGMGTVYLSRTRGNQPVALKVIRREYAQDPEFRRRFEQEARAARQVQGYHVVPVVDHDTSGPRPWLATAYVPGPALDGVLASYGPLPLSSVLQLVGCTAEALHAVHRAGVIHRDLKPSNVLIGPDGPWVIDFGIARAADATQLTRSGGFIGTPQFMSPEHANGQPLTPATDVFSLGLVAAVSATGRHPYGDAGAITVAAQIANTEIRPPDLTGYPDPLRGLLERCLAADPRARPAPAELAGLCQELSGRPLREFAGWLPVPVAADVARRALAAERFPDPAAGARTVPPEGYGYGTGTGPPAGPGTGTGPPAGPGAGTGAGAAAAPPAGHRTVPPAGPPTAPPVPSGPPRVPYGDGPAPRSAGRRRVALAAGAVAAAAALVLSGWLYGHWAGADRTAGSGKDGAARPGASGGAQSRAPGAGTPAAQKGAAYKVVFQDRPFALRWPSTGYTRFDLDTAKAMPLGADFAVSDWAYSDPGGPGDSYEMDFATATGFSDDTSPEGCRTAAGANALSSRLDAAQVDRRITVGTVLCTVTKEDRVAMVRVTGVEDNDGKPDFLTQLTVWEKA